MKLIPLLIMISYSSLSQASIPPGQWQCIAFDHQKHEFIAFGFSLQSALKSATAKCKQNTSQPASCQSAQSFCEQGPLSLNEQRCLVTDNAGHSWDTNGPDACKTAMSMCYNFLYLQAGPRGQCSVKHGG